jgi:hypothetical protein
MEPIVRLSAALRWRCTDRQLRRPTDRLSGLVLLHVLPGSRLLADPGIPGAPSYCERTGNVQCGLNFDDSHFRRAYHADLP